jgi:hypothetical protein
MKEEFSMFNKLYVYIGKNILPIIFILVGFGLLLTIFNLIDVVRKPAAINIVEGSVQHHLVWDNKGQCYFVRPYSNEVVYLIRVQDCDKK